MTAILAIDDNRDNLDLVEDILSQEDYDVRCVDNPHEALAIIENNPPSLAVVDWLMPDMDGLELCGQIRSRCRQMSPYLLMLTANSGEQHLRASIDAGADDYLAKPFRRGELIARVRAGMRIATLQQQLARQNDELIQVNKKLSRANEMLARQANHDDLTGLVNSRLMRTQLQRYWANAQRHHQPLSCIMIDIDHFKDINDTYGHSAGDTVLQDVAAVMARTSRQDDPVYRVGGEEFLVICPNTSAEMATAAAERIRLAVELHRVVIDDKEITVTISAGVARNEPHMKQPEDLLKTADDALYVAKRGGRNCVKAAPWSYHRTTTPARTPGDYQPFAETASR